MSSPVSIAFRAYTEPKRWHSDIGEHVGIGDVVVTCAEHGEVVRFMTTSTIDRDYPATHGNAVLAAANHHHFEHAELAPGTRVILDDPGFGPYRGRVVVCLCKRHTWQPELQGRECGHAQCGFPPAADACPWPMHVIWDDGNEAHEGAGSVRREA